MRLLTLVASLALALSSLAQTVVFRDVNVVAMTSPKVAEKQTVVVRDGKIEAILKSLDMLPEGATVVDGSGKYLMPGLAEMHGHIPPPNAPNGLLQDVLTMYLANGITTVRGMLGHDGQLNLRDWQKKGELVAPNLYLAGPAFTGQAVKTPQEAIDRVKLQKKEGWDLLKVHEGLSLATYDALAKTAKAEGMRFAGHVPDDVGLLHALAMGQETIDHMDGYVEFVGGDKGPVDEKKLAEIVKKSKAAGVWVVPTSALWKVVYNGIPLATLEAYPELKYLPPQASASWVKMYTDRASKIDPAVTKNVLTARTRILEALHKGGVKILMGTDAPQQFSIPGFSLHRELLVMRESGLTPYEILKTGTVNPGQYFAKQDNFGTIETGKRADLVLLNANPLDNVENVDQIEGVMVRGRWYSRKDLDEKLKYIVDRYKVKVRAQ